MAVGCIGMVTPIFTVERVIREPAALLDDPGYQGFTRRLAAGVEPWGQKKDQGESAGFA